MSRACRTICATTLFALTAGPAPATVLVSAAPDGVVANNNSSYPVVSLDGRYVAFLSQASDLATAMGVSCNGRAIYVRDLETGINDYVTGADPGLGFSISGDGRYVAYGCAGNICVRDRVASTTQNLGFAYAGTGSTATSADGRFVVYEGYRPELMAAHQVDLYDRCEANGTPVGSCTPGRELISVSSAEVPGDSRSEGPSISADGNYVAFSSDATNLVASDNNFGRDVFVRDRTLGTTTRASVNNAGVESNCTTTAAEGSISADGRYVAFQHCGTNLTPEVASSSSFNVFVRDLVGLTTVLASRHTNGAVGTGSSDTPRISSDGNYVAFSSYASNLVDDDTNGRADVFRHDVSTGTTVRVSVNTAGAQSDYAGNLDYLDLSISGDGSRVAFASRAINLTHGDSNASSDVFVWADCGAVAPTCGDGTHAIGCEACDDGDLDSGDGCDANCTITGCSNGIITTGEGCDDGNAWSGDGCSYKCNVEQPLDVDTRTCVNTVNVKAVGVAKTQAKLAQGCLKAAANGLEPDAQACLTADPNLKLMKAKDKVTAAAALRCNPAPAFGFTSAAATNTAAQTAQLDLVADLFGNNLTAAVIDATTDPAGAKCQAKVLKTLQKLSETQSKLFLKCKKVGMADLIEPILSSADLETCFDIVRDDAIILPKAQQKLSDVLADDCIGVDLASAFPGQCADPSPVAMRYCLTSSSGCHFSLMFNAIDGVNDFSDLTDDCVINASCP